MRRGHEGADVLHLHAGLALEDEGGPRARVCVSRNGGLCARVVLGGAGEDFVRGGRGEHRPTNWTRGGRGGTRVVYASKVPRGRAVCPRMGCWKTVVGRREGDWALRECGDDQAWERIMRCRQDEDALSVREAELAMNRRLGAPFGAEHSHRADQSCNQLCYTRTA